MADEDVFAGVDNDTERLRIEAELIAATDNGARPEDGDQPAEPTP